MAEIDHSPSLRKYGVSITLDGALIGQTIDLGGEIIHRVMNTAEAQVRQSLIDLGWAPPPEDRPRLPAEEFNTLPENVRRYIHMIETDCDPSGTIRSEMHLRDLVQELEAALAEARQ